MSITQKGLIEQKKEALKKFRERYQNGEGDVIYGLLHMDNLKEEIKVLEAKKPDEALPFEEGK